MKQSILLLSYFLFLTALKAQVYPVETVLDNGLANKRIKYVFLSDGYLSSELPNFITQVGAFRDNIFTQTPFKEYKNFFNFYAIKVPSTQSGCNHPATASDEASSGGQPSFSVNTFFNSTFDYANIRGRRT